MGGADGMEVAEFLDLDILTRRILDLLADDARDRLLDNEVTSKLEERARP